MDEKYEDYNLEVDVDVDVDVDDVDDVDDDVEETEKEPNKKTKLVKKSYDENYEDDEEKNSDNDYDIEEEDEEEEDEEEDDDENDAEKLYDDLNKNLNDKQTPFADLDNFSDDDEDDNEEDDNYLQKFDDYNKEKIIEDFHPELKTQNYDEIDILSKIVRDENGVIIDPLHKTLPFITRYEKARILGERTKQINSGAKPIIEVDSNIIDGYLIALKEYEQKKIPFIIKRPLPNGGCEYWRFEDLELLE
jgi:DNA-directed RNA polymerase subunit K/omega